MPTRRVHVPEGASWRVDRLLADALAPASRRTIHALLEAGAIRIDGRRARKGDIVRGERSVEIDAPDLSALAAEPELTLAVLHEDARCIALDKPAGRPGHALRANQRGTVANFLAARYPECLAAGANALEAGLVHRLDTDTSGVLLAARDAGAWRTLRTAFGAGEVEKRYLALVAGDVPSGGEIRRAIAADDRRRVRVLADEAPGAGARPAVTRYRPLRRSPVATLVEVEIPTGVRHQIRAHLAAIGHPVLGDGTYGAPSPEAPRHLLHASRLAFRSPDGDREIVVESPLPEDFAEALRRCGLS